MLCWSLDALLRAGLTRVFVAAPSAWLDTAAELLADRSGTTIVPGGATRQESVGACLSAVDEGRVVVHDAVRPLAPPGLVASVLSGLAAGADAVVAATAVDETLKRVREGRVVETVDRTGLWSIQTPQAFATDRLKEAHERARRDGFVATDDAQLIERYGGRVTVVEARRTNMKITYPEDLLLAESLVRTMSG